MSRINNKKTIKIPPKIKINASIPNKSGSLRISTPPSTPVSRSPSPPTPNERLTQSSNQHIYSIESTLTYAQYEPLEKITQTLQGSIWKVSKNDHTYIVKVTNKQLHNKHITNWNGQQIHIFENVIQEAAILRHLSNNNPPPELAKYIDFFYDEFNYFFVQEYGGKMSLFEFVKKCHQYIKHKMLSMEEWQKFCKNSMKQMINLVDWLHNKMNCTHLDLSLENFVIDNVMVMENTETKTIKFLPGYQIRIIDFGLAEVFCNKNDSNEISFQCNKYVGKTQYKCPEIYKKKGIFDARAADMWSLSVVFFIMWIGSPPWYKPSQKDVTFNLIMNGQLEEILIEWNKMKYVNSNIFTLLELMFQDEKYRLTIREMKRHPCFL